MQRHRSFIGWQAWFLVFKAFVYGYIFLMRKVPRTWEAIDNATFRKAVSLAIHDHLTKCDITEDDLKRAEKILKGENA